MTNKLIIKRPFCNKNIDEALNFGFRRNLVQSANEKRIICVLYVGPNDELLCTPSELYNWIESQNNVKHLTSNCFSFSTRKLSEHKNENILSINILTADVKEIIMNKMFAGLVAINNKENDENEDNKESKPKRRKLNPDCQSVLSPEHAIFYESPVSLNISNISTLEEHFQTNELVVISDDEEDEVNDIKDYSKYIAGNGFKTKETFQNKDNLSIYATGEDTLEMKLSHNGSLKPAKYGPGAEFTEKETELKKQFLDLPFITNVKSINKEDNETNCSASNYGQSVYLFPLSCSSKSVDNTNAEIGSFQTNELVVISDDEDEDLNLKEYSKCISESEIILKDAFKYRNIEEKNCIGNQPNLLDNQNGVVIKPTERVLKVLETENQYNAESVALLNNMQICKDNETNFPPANYMEIPKIIDGQSVYLCPLSCSNTYVDNSNRNAQIGSFQPDELVMISDDEDLNLKESESGMSKDQNIEEKNCIGNQPNQNDVVLKPTERVLVALETKNQYNAESVALLDNITKDCQEMKMDGSTIVRDENICAEALVSNMLENDQCVSSFPTSYNSKYADLTKCKLFGTIESERQPCQISESIEPLQNFHKEVLKKLVNTDKEYLLNRIQARLLPPCTSACRPMDLEMKNFMFECGSCLVLWHKRCSGYCYVGIGDKNMVLCDNCYLASKVLNKSCWELFCDPETLLMCEDFSSNDHEQMWVKDLFRLLQISKGAANKTTESSFRQIDKKTVVVPQLTLEKPQETPEVIAVEDNNVKSPDLNNYNQWRLIYHLKVTKENLKGALEQTVIIKLKSNELKALSELFADDYLRLFVNNRSIPIRHEYITVNNDGELQIPITRTITHQHNAFFCSPFKNQCNDMNFSGKVARLYNSLVRSFISGTLSNNGSGKSISLMQVRPVSQIPQSSQFSLVPSLQYDRPIQTRRPLHPLIQPTTSNFSPTSAYFSYNAPQSSLVPSLQYVRPTLAKRPHHSFVQPKPPSYFSPTSAYFSYNAAQSSLVPSLQYVRPTLAKRPRQSFVQQKPPSNFPPTSAHSSYNAPQSSLVPSLQYVCPTLAKRPHHSLVQPTTPLNCPPTSAHSQYKPLQRFEESVQFSTIQPTFAQPQRNSTAAFPSNQTCVPHIQAHDAQNTAVPVVNQFLLSKPIDMIQDSNKENRHQEVLTTFVKDKDNAKKFEAIKDIYL